MTWNGSCTPEEKISIGKCGSAATEKNVSCPHVFVW